MNSQNEQEFAKRERKRTEIEARLSASNIGSADGAEPIRKRVAHAVAASGSRTMESTCCLPSILY